MTDTAVLLTPALIEADKFAAFVEKFGGFLDPNRPGTAWIPRGDCRVWVAFGPECGPDILADALSEDEEVITKKLGTSPRSCVVLEISRKSGSQILAVDFAVAFAEHWPTVVSDVEDRLLDLADLKRLQREGKGFGSDSAPMG
jgi:hypothetical protein